MLVEAKLWARDNFRADSRPSLERIKRWIDKGEITGQKLGNTYYVDVHNNTTLVGKKPAKLYRIKTDTPQH